MGSRVPATFDDLTAEWLDEALREGNVVRAVVDTVEVEPLGASVGLVGDLARLRVRYRSGSAPSTYIVKLPTAEPGGHQVGTMLNAWGREVAFYQDIAPESSAAEVPTCFHSAADPDAGRWVVVLEDRPGDEIDPVAGASDAQAGAAIDALAVFHAAWWEAPERFDWMPGFDTTGVGGLQDSWLDAHPIFLERYAHVVPSPTGEWLTRFAPTLRSWSDKAAGEPITIVHTDYRLDNLLFAGGRVTIIDWQTALRGPAAMDVSCFLATSLSIENRRRLEPELIGRYLDGLAARNVTVDRTWFEQSYDENLLWWMGQFANNLARLKPDDPAVQAALDQMIERTFTAALDRNAGRLLP